MGKMTLGKLFVLLSAGVVLIGCSTQTTQKTDTNNEAKVEQTAPVAEVKATIDILVDGETIKDGKKEVTVPEGTLLMEAMTENYIVVEEGGFVSSINGVEQDLDAKRYWMYYVNDEMPSVGAAEYEIQEGDQIDWRLEDSEF